MLIRNRIASVCIDIATSSSRRSYVGLQKRTTSLPRFRPKGAFVQRSFYGQASHSGPKLPHDLGGSLDFGSFAIDTNPGELQVWEKECHALFAVLASKSFFKTDQLRRAIEDLTPRQYSDWSYYGRWTAAMATLLVDGGMLSADELRAALFGKPNERHVLSLFRPGDAVRVKSYQQGVEWRRPHIRTPGYVYGVKGRVVGVCGKFGDPSFLAFGIECPKVWLYRVEISMQDLWPEQSSAKDTLSIEIYEHWLEASNTDTGHDFQETKLLNHDDDGKDCSDHHHGHGHHSHDPRPVVEQKAAANEGPPRPGKEFFRALFRVLLDRELVTRDEVRAMIEYLDSAGTNLLGRDLVVKAWNDREFEQRLLNDPASAALEIGIQTTNPNAPTVLTVVQNTPAIHNLVVCTLCSCYPSGLLGIAPSWYKSNEFRARAVREPREVLRDFGTLLPTGQSIRVHDSTADHRYLVLPQRPKGTENWSEEFLKELVTRDSMIGVTFPMRSNH